MALDAASSAGIVPASQSHQQAVPRAAHLDYVDALRVVLILLVVAHHSVEAYVSDRSPEVVLPDAPIPHAWVFLWVNASFFMGLFFFLAGYFTPGSYDRKGGGRFLSDRFLRLGIPLLIGTLLIVPIQGWVHVAMAPWAPPTGFLTYLFRDFFGVGGKPDFWPADRRWPEFNFGHLWFLEHLLVYALLCAAWLRFAPTRRRGPAVGAPPGNMAIGLYAIGLAIASVAIRHWYPIDRWIGFLGFIQMEPAHLPQYASLFVIGCYAGPRDWIARMPTRRGLGWLAVGGGLAVLAYVLIGTGVLGGIDVNNVGGCLWEALLCTGLCVGLPVAFRELALGAGALWRTLERNVLAIYVFHFPFVLLVQWLLMNTDWPKWLRLIVTMPIAATLTFALTNYVILRLPGARRVF